MSRRHNEPVVLLPGPDRFTSDALRAAVERPAAHVAATPALTDEDLDAIEARLRERVRLCEHSERDPVTGCYSSPCGTLATQRCVAGGDRNVESCDAHVVPYSGACDHRWERTDDVDALRLVAEVRRLDNEIENLRIAATIGPRVAEVNVAVERAASIARFRSVIDDFLRAPEMFARDPECGANVVYGAMLAAGGNGRTWYDAALAVGLARGNVAVAAETWDDVRRLARHLRETAETWAVRL